MGLWIQLLTSLGLLKKKSNVLFIGLDNSGKSTIINNLKQVDKLDLNEITPTVGFSVSMFQKGSITFTAFDMSGQGKYRDLWEHYFNDTEAIVFVIDCSDRLRSCVARDELEGVLKNSSIQDKRIPILFFANKNDIEEVMTPTEVSQVLGLENIKTHNWYISSSNALTGEGLIIGLEWLVHELEKKNA